VEKDYAGQSDQKNFAVFAKLGKKDASWGGGTNDGGRKAEKIGKRVMDASQK